MGDAIGIPAELLVRLYALVQHTACVSCPWDPDEASHVDADPKAYAKRLALDIDALGLMRRGPTAADRIASVECKLDQLMRILEHAHGMAP